MRKISPRYRIELNNSVIVYHKNKLFSDPAFTLTSDVVNFSHLLTKATTLNEAMRNKTVELKGSTDACEQLLSLIDVFPSMFNIVTP
ncbi:alkyl sulfatase C-terminal domain-containing protein [Enterobacter kobei]